MQMSASVCASSCRSSRVKMSICRLDLVKLSRSFIDHYCYAGDGWELFARCDVGGTALRAAALGVSRGRAKHRRRQCRVTMGLTLTRIPVNRREESINGTACVVGRTCGGQGNSVNEH